MGQIEQWFEENKRDFPWRQKMDPYRVWISEVMLQQTRASVVIPYFLRWMDLFPDVKSLYMAPLDQVIKAWEGLGYYSRARNLHLAAKQIVEEFGGGLPDTREALLSIRGFGPYTTGAVLSFAFHKKSSAVDGNVLRVISRLFCIKENIEKREVRKQIEEKTESLLDGEFPWVTMEALIELGALVCTPKPQCERCPMISQCLGREIAEYLPVKGEKKRVIALRRFVFVIICDVYVLIRKGERGKMMADLYEFPYAEMNQHEFGEVEFLKKMTPCVHTFTRYKAHLFPSLFQMKEKRSFEGFEWVAISRAAELPFSSGHRKILKEVI